MPSVNRESIKGLYVKKFEKDPPKIHNLIFFVEKIGVQIPDDLHDFVFALNNDSIIYPDDLEEVLQDYNEDISKKILMKGRQILQWLKEILHEWTGNLSRIDKPQIQGTS